MTFGGARMQAVFTISHATIDYGAFNRKNFNTAIDHLTRLLIIRGKNPLYGIIYSKALLIIMVCMICSCLAIIIIVALSTLAISSDMMNS